MTVHSRLWLFHWRQVPFHWNWVEVFTVRVLNFTDNFLKTFPPSHFLILDRVNDKWLRLIGIPLLWWINISVNDYYKRAIDAQMVLKAIVTLLSITAVWHLMRGCIIYFRDRYPEKSQVGKRLGLTFLVGSITTTLLLWLTDAIQHLIVYGSLADFRIGRMMGSITVNNRTLSLGFYGFDMVQSLANFIFFQAMYEIIFFIHTSSQREKRLRLAEQERELLRATNLQSQLDALKQQVNPHFLFNSLNVLDSLIEDDPRQARLFLEELSTVYRYLLRSNEHHLTDLASELDFIYSYYHLLKTRLGDGIQLNVTIQDCHLQSRLPPLTLQLLVENAYKHNVVLPDQPLVINISVNEAGNLLVSNNVQRKRVRVASNGVGLTNILNKYLVLNQSPPAISEAGGKFEVTIPLISSSD